MRLRARVALTAVAVLVPMIATLVVYDNVARRRAAQRMLGDFAQRVINNDHERCEEDPTHWGGVPSRFGGRRDDRSGPPNARNHHGEGRRGSPWPDRPPAPPSFGPGGRRPAPASFFAYSDNFQSANPQAPPINAELQSALGSHNVAVANEHWWSPNIAVLIRTEFEHGPCAVVLARGTTGEWGAILPEGWFWTVPLFVVIGSIFVALGPLVRRIQKLTDMVRRSADASYSLSVEVGGNDEVAELAKAFDAAGAEIREQLMHRETRERVLREFVANTTHDVMIPLTVLQGHLTSLREAAAAGTTDPQTVVSAMNEAHYLASLVHNLAAMARLEGPEARFQPGPVDLNALVARVVGRHNPIAEERGITLESAAPAEAPVAWADVTLLEQAVSNIAYNAVRYNRRGGHVAVILETTPERRFSIRVVDDGPGVTQEELATITDRGVRGNGARTRAPDGQGLGLHIAYRSAELHGYRLTLSHSEYGGLEAKLEGPMDAPSGQA